MEVMNMKKGLLLFLVGILIFSLLTACSEAGGADESNAGNSASVAANVSSNVAKSSNDVIKASVLISKEDASAILGQSLEDDKITFVGPFIDAARYISENITLQIDLSQEALHDKESKLEIKLLKNGWSDYMRQMEKTYFVSRADQNIAKVEGTLGTYYLQEGTGFGTWILHVFYGDYYTTISLSNASMNYTDSEDEISWKHEKLREIGDLAVEHLKAIVG